MSKCSQCNGSGYVQTSFGPKPCPTCHGSGYVDSEETSVSKKVNTMSTIEILLYSALAGVIGFFIFAPLGLFLPIIFYFYLDDRYGK